MEEPFQAFLFLVLGNRAVSPCRAELRQLVDPQLFQRPEAPAIVQRRSAPEQANTRSWEKEVLIIGGSAGAGTAIGALAGGKKGAGVGAAVGGVGGLIYDLLTRDKK